MKKKWTLSCLCVSSLCLFATCYADTAIITGVGNYIISSNAPNYPLIYSLSIGSNSVSSIAPPNGNPAAIVPVAIDETTGAFVTTGQNDVDGTPLIYSGSVFNSSVNSISVPSNSLEGFIVSAAFSSTGSAVFGGTAYGEGYSIPIAYQLSPNATQAVSINLPGTIAGQISAVAFFPNKSAILVGINYDTSAPLIYTLPQGNSEATLIALPDSSIQGNLNCVAVTPNGTAIMAGQDGTNHQSLIYTLNFGETIANPISIPDTGDGSFISSIAIGPDGTVLLAGGTNTSPIIYRISPGSTVASLVTNATEGNGYINGVAIGSDGVAILVGFINDFPLIYRVDPGSSQATSISLPDQAEGSLNAVAIGEELVAVLVGGSYENSPSIYTLSSGASVASRIEVTDSFSDFYLLGVAIYSPSELYDIYRIAPYYYNQIEQTKNTLIQAGILPRTSP
jgi:WD40 repeat protein